MPTAEEIIKRMKRLEEDRSNWDGQWQECADYGMPQNNQITRKKAAGQAGDDLFDTTGEESNIQLSAGLYSYMFPTDSRAFVLQAEDEELNEIDDVKKYFDKVTKIIHQYLVSSNFRQAFFEYLKQLGCFGTACLYEEKGKKTPINFICHHMSGVYIARNSDGDVDTVYRAFEYTARQAVQEFKEYEKTLGAKILEVAEKNQEKKFKFIHVVVPREDADDEKDDPKSMPWASFWVNRDEKQIIYESGYPEMPYQITVFDKDAQEVYGRSPMMKSLPDIKMVNRMQKTRIKGWEKQVDPPTLLPDDGSIWPLATQPGGVIYYRAGGVEPKYWEFKGDLREMEKAILTVQQKIERGFFLNLFDPLIDRKNMTATEVLARMEQLLRFLTPVIGRQQSGLSNPMVHRIIGVLGRQGLLPDIPDELKDKNYNIMYLGRLALALKTLETEGLAKTLADWAPMAQAERTAWLDNLEEDRAFRDSARNNGMPATWLKDIDIVKADRETKQQQAQAQALMEQAPGLAKAAKDLSKPIEDGSPLQEIVNAT